MFIIVKKEVRKMYDNIIFDFNGTLIDDCELCLKILNYLTKEYNLGKVSMEKYKDIFTFPVYLYYKDLGFDTSTESFKVIASKFHSYYNELSYDEVKLFDDVIEVLNILSKNTTLVCLSASLKETLDKQLKYYGIFDYFKYVVGLDNSYANSKEQVAIEFINKSNFNKKKTLFVGDSIHDFEVASAMGVDCILVATGHTSKERLLKTGCKVIDNLKELL